MKRRRESGMTLIEILVVVVIVSILALIALPSYLAQLQQSRRADASIAIESLAQEQERFFSRFRTYTSVVVAPDGCAGIACGLGQIDNLSQNDYYVITVASNATSYALTATASGPQLDDADCRTMSVNSVGIRSSTDKSGGDSTDVCW